MCGICFTVTAKMQNGVLNSLWCKDILLYVCQKERCVWNSYLVDDDAMRNQRPRTTSTSSTDLFVAIFIQLDSTSIAAVTHSLL